MEAGSRFFFLLLTTGFPAPARDRNPMPSVQSPCPGRPGCGARDRGLELGEALDRPWTHRPATATRHANRSGLTRRPGVYPNCPAQRERFGHGERAWQCPREVAHSKAGWFNGCGRACPVVCWIEAAPSRPGFEACWCRRLLRERRDQDCTAPSIYPVGHLALMPRFMTDLASGGEVVDDGVFRGVWGLEPGARSLEKNTLSEEGLVVDKVLGQCGEVRGRYGGIAGRSFEAGCRLAADPMHPSTACMVGSAVAQSDVRRRPGWRCALTASSTDGNGGALGTGGLGGFDWGERGGRPLSVSPPQLDSKPSLVLVLCPGDSHQQCPPAQAACSKLNFQVLTYDSKAQTSSRPESAAQPPPSTLPRQTLTQDNRTRPPLDLSTSRRVRPRLSLILPPFPRPPTRRPRAMSTLS